MELQYNPKTGSFEEVPESYGNIECQTKEDYQWACHALRTYNELEDKHWSECGQIAKYDNDMTLLKQIIRDRLAYVKDYGKKILDGTYSDSYDKNEGYCQALIDVLDIIGEVTNDEGFLP